MQHQETLIPRLVLLSLLWSVGALPAAPPAVTSVTPEQYFRRVVEPHRGRVLAVNFWATWCEPCREEMPGFLAAGRSLANDGVDIVLVSADVPRALPEVERFLRGLGVRPPCFREQSDDPQRFIDAVDPKWGGDLPHTVVYSRDGARVISLSKQTRAGFERAFREALSATSGRAGTRAPLSE